ncbi:histidinol-phosphatase [Hyphobacterium sp. HN65]|uniref:Histidinol-phosphatase n=1 Tax=Hyphobacterium lacteum TaxID=3116575 RepID=A0ABU7LPJ4_9PROT|nr:histidinol-phosphatase [Hyphobacterium sp. HN65]MEE2525835.1 histidinol-phosphatase [Hyphobacterium sp. HN65]
MNGRNLETELAFAHRLADAAGAAILPHFRNNTDVENKAGTGFDPVTIADRAAEQAIRDLIAAERPGDGILGEEFPVLPSRNGWSWTLDPIDGTRGFIAGTPTWCVLIALTFDGEPVLGVIDQPHTKERFSGFGGSADLSVNGQKSLLRTSGIPSLDSAILATTDPYLFRDNERDAFGKIRSKVRLTRYGMDAYAYALLAAGGIDLVVESGLNLYDLHALVPVVRAAGGVITNWQGNDDFTTGQLVAAANSSLHAETLALLVS